ncbi:MAG: aspartate--tRNA(Asn) ligase [Bacteroidales bacterium]
MKVVVANSHVGMQATELLKYDGQEIIISGAVHKVRKLGALLFIVIRTGKSLIQCTLVLQHLSIPAETYQEGNYVTITGICHKEENAPNGAEIELKSIKVLSQPAVKLPFSIGGRNLGINLDTNLDYRPISLRHIKQRAIFSIQSSIVQLFLEGLGAIDFVKIHTPKLVFAGAEGGANVFKVDYFDRVMFLAQSPQFYKQMMVGVFGKVMEVGPVFRAESHETSRHLNEYTSMDIEMGPIDSFEDIMDVETYILNYIFDRLPSLCPSELEVLKVNVPKVGDIPVMKMAQVLEIVSKEHKVRDSGDLDAKSEQIISQYVYDNTGSEFLFVTHYPTAKRPMYAMEDPIDPTVTLSFDLLFRGLEVTTGGQRIHNYEMQVEKMKRLGYNPVNFSSYLQIHRYGMPPHGGFGLGLERLTMQLLGLGSIKEASLFPRTISRIFP